MLNVSKHGQRVPSHLSESTEVLYVPAHITEVPCHSISGLRQFYNYMCSGTYYLIIGALSLATSLRRGSEVRSNFFSFTLQTCMDLSYTYRVLISPIDESS